MSASSQGVRQRRAAAAAQHPARARFERLDALRGVAIVWMALFHFCFDLNYFGFLHPRQNFYADPFWTVQRTVIVSLFLFVAGLSQAVAMEAGQGWPRFWRRWAQVAGCAVLVSLGSAWMFPRSWISFGVLHGIAVMLIVARLAAPLRGGLWLLGALALLLPWVVQDPFFDSRWTNWLGLVTHKPVTEDYVPVLPWLGVMLFGLAAGQALLRRHAAPADERRAADGHDAADERRAADQCSAPPASASLGLRLLAGPLAAPWRPLAVLGRWSLSFYMLHQPVLIGLLMGWRALAS